MQTFFGGLLALMSSRRRCRWGGPSSRIAAAPVIARTGLERCRPATRTHADPGWFQMLNSSSPLRLSDSPNASAIKKTENTTEILTG